MNKTNTETEINAKLKDAEEQLFNEVIKLRARSNESLESGNMYCFVLCNAKMNYINKVLNDIRYALSGYASEKIVNKVLNIINSVDEDFNKYIGTDGNNSTDIEMPDMLSTFNVGDTIHYTTTDDYGYIMSGIGTIESIVPRRNEEVLFKIISDGFVSREMYIYNNNPSYPNDKVFKTQSSE